MPTEFICNDVPKSGGNVNGSVWSWAGPPASSRSVDILVGVGVSLRRFFYAHWERQLQEGNRKTFRNDIYTFLKENYTIKGEGVQ